MDETGYAEENVQDITVAALRSCGNTGPGNPYALRVSEPIVGATEVLMTGKKRARVKERI